MEFHCGQKVNKCTSFISSRAQRAVSRIFRVVGWYAWERPYLYLLSGVILTVLCSLGNVLLNEENDGVRLWVPADSEIISNYDEVIDMFGEFETSCVWLLSNKNGEDMMQSDKLDVLFEFFKYVTYNLSTNYESKDWDYSDLCVRDYPSYPTCDAVESNIYYLYGNNPDNWATQSQIQTRIRTDAGQAFAEFYLGDLVYNSSIIINGKYFRMLWGLASTSNDTIYEANYEFMQAFIDYIEDLDSSELDDLGIEYSYFTSRSIEDELGRVVTSDLGIYAATFIVMFVYLAATLGDFSCIGARCWLAVVTMTCMVMALAAGYGLGALIGMDINSVVFLIPYLLIGVGVDDEILIIEAIDREPYPNGDFKNGAERFAHALQHCGLSISLTTFCSVAAFIVGTNVTMPGVQAFCAYAAFCFWLNYMLQFLIFLPLLALDEQRKNAKRNFCCWFIKHENDDSNNDSNASGQTQTGTSDAGGAIAGICQYIGVLSLMNYIVIPSLTKRLYRFGFVLLFVALFITSIISLQWLKVESDTSRLVPDDSYVINYLDDAEGAYGSSSLIVVDIVLTHLDFSSNETRNSIFDMIEQIESYDSSKTDAFAIGDMDEWLTPFSEYIIDVSNDTLSIDDLDQTEFYQYLQSFANTTEYAEWANEIVYDDVDNPTQIRATRFYIDFSAPDTLSGQWPVREDLTEIVEDTVGSDNGYAFHKNWPFAYFEYEIVGLTVRNIGSASGGVLIILMILMDIKMAWFITLVVVMIDIELFGWMVLCGAALDSITFLQLVMAVGLTVDYVIHISHALTDAESPDNNFDQKVAIAMREMGVGVVKGAWTTFLGIVSLSFSSSEAFRGFFIVFAGIILVAVANGLFFVPSLMAELKCLWLGHHDNHVSAKKSHLELPGMKAAQNPKSPSHKEEEMREAMTKSEQNTSINSFKADEDGGQALTQISHQNNTNFKYGDSVDTTQQDEYVDPNQAVEMETPKAANVSNIKSTPV